jgi:hypothetical protein
MGTYTSGSGAGAELYTHVPLANAWVVGEGEDDALNWSSAVAKIAVGDDNALALSYELEDMSVDSGQLEGRRPFGGPFEDAEGGRLQVDKVILEDYGKNVRLDDRDQTLNGRNKDEVGAERAGSTTKTLLARRLAAILTAASPPWTGLSDRTESGLWSTPATNILGDMITANQAYRAAQTLVTPPLRGLAVGENVWDSFLINEKMVAQYGGNTGAGTTDEMLVLNALSKIGIKHVTVFAHQLMGGTVTRYAFAGPDADPGMPGNAAGLVFGHNGTSGQMVQALTRETVQGTGDRVHNFVARVSGEFAVVPLLGYRWDDVLS